MRDLVEAEHILFTEKNRYYYKDNLEFKIKPNDYINFVRNYITDKNYSIRIKKPYSNIKINI